MTKKGHNWQYSNEKIISLHEWRLFIKEYQSSPTELVVSAINENSNKEDSKNDRIKKAIRDNYDDEDDNIEEDGAVKIMGALGEVVARKILYFSTFEDMTF